MSLPNLKRASVDERSTIERWRFWVSLCAEDPDERRKLAARAISWTIAAEAEGLSAAPPWLMLIMGLSLSASSTETQTAQQSDDELLISLGESLTFNEEARELFFEFCDTWVNALEGRRDWRLARRRLVIIDPSLHERLIGLCIQIVVSDQAETLFDEADLLDPTTLSFAHRYLTAHHHPWLFYQMIAL